MERAIVDLYELDGEWSEEQKAVCQQVRRFVDREVIPAIRANQEQGVFPRELIQGIAKLGITEAIVSGDLDATAYGLVMRELERGSSTVRSLISVQSALVIFPISEFGSDEQKRRWLGPLGKLDAVGCFGLTEPDFGSNPAGMRTRATKVSDGYRISGSKRWITNGTIADVAVVWAKLEGKVRGFLVETDRKGFEARSITGKWSFRTSDTGELYLDEVEVPESALLPGARSLGSAIKCLNEARYSIAWGVIGAARACFEQTVEYLLARPQFDDKPLASHQLVQNKLAWMATEITGMELISKRLGELKAAGRMQPIQVSLAKMNNCRKALEVARTCRDLLGASGIHNEYDVGRHLMDLETVLTYEGTEHIHALVIGQALTGIRAFS
jgi:glutaryl-CoA dehydrogenase